MDANKLKVLQEIGLEVRAICKNCKHFKQLSDKLFGECEKHKYNHLKHTGKERNLSVYSASLCSSHEWDPNELALIHAYSQFIK